MNRRALIALKAAVWMASLAPLALLIRGALGNALGPDPTAHLAHATGSTALNLLALSLVISPLRRFVPALGWTIRFRRLLGLFAFFYASLHLFVYVALYAGFDSAAVATDLVRRRYIVAGFAAWALLTPLAATSTQRAIRWLGKRWSTLHRLVYLAAALAIVHYWWLVKPGVLEPLGMTLVLAVLLGVRLLWRVRTV